jgi:outer membrane protein OmpA-like peptidoglycan-associated protein
MKLLRIAPMFSWVLTLGLVFGLAQSGEAGVGKLWPFATKKHIKGKIDPLSGRVGELEEISNEHAKKIKEIDERTQAAVDAALQGVQAADAKATLAQERASAARTTAQEASQRIGLFSDNVDTRLGNVENYQKVASVQVSFGVNQSTLNQESQFVLDDLVRELGSSKGYVLEIEGFADPRGSKQQNLELSRQRANSVVRYLVETHQVPLFRIRTIGKGDANAITHESGRIDYGKSRRVEIHLLRNDVVQIAAKEQGS